MLSNCGCSKKHQAIPALCTLLWVLPKCFDTLSICALYLHFVGRPRRRLSAPVDPTRVGIDGITPEHLSWVVSATLRKGGGCSWASPWVRVPPPGLHESGHSRAGAGF